MRGGPLSGQPSLTSRATARRLLFFTFFALFSLLLVNVCSLVSTTRRGSSLGYSNAPAHRRKTPKKRASGCWAQRRLKGWNEKGVICSPLDFLLPPSRKKKKGGTFKWRKLHQTALLKAARIPKHDNKSRSERQNFL